MRDFAGTVRESADIVRVVSDYVALKGAGSSLKGLCPFHSEKTPSFWVHRDKRFFHCFGCGAGGDVFKFVMMIERMEFPEALRLVAEKSGVPIPADTGPWGGGKQAEERQQLLDLYSQTAAYYHGLLNSADATPARQALGKRQVSVASIERFQLGYAPSSGLMQSLRPKVDPLTTGLFQRSDNGDVYERFRRRLMFPIWNERGKVIGFGGRILGDGEPKYLNSPESPLYKKSEVLYALHLARDAARKSGRMVMVEGYFDCLSLHQHGIENVVASCGTALTPQQVDLVARYVPEVVMNYDPDAAGQNAIRRSIDLLLEKGLRVRVLKLPGSLDPDDFVRKEGGEVYRRLLESAPYFWQYLVADAASRFDLANPSMKADAVREVMDHVVKIQDRVEQLEVAKSVAQGFKIPEGLVLERLRVKARTPDIALARRAETPVPARRLANAEKQLIQALTQGNTESAQVSQALQQLSGEAFWKESWSWPVLEQLILTPDNLNFALDQVEDEELCKQVRAAVAEPVGPLTFEHAQSSVQKLYDAHFEKRQLEMREQLKQCGAEGAPAELLQKHREIVSERIRMAAALKPRAS